MDENKCGEIENYFGPNEVARQNRNTSQVRWIVQLTSQSDLVNPVLRLKTIGPFEEA